MGDESIMWLANPIPDPVVKFTLVFDEATDVFVNSVHAKLLELDWEMSNYPNSFISQYLGTTYKEEHIWELIQYAELAVDESVQSVLADGDCVGGEAIIEIDGIGKYQYSFMFPGDFENFSEPLETYYSLEDSGIKTKPSLGPNLKIIK